MDEEEIKAVSAAILQTSASSRALNDSEAKAYAWVAIAALDKHRAEKRANPEIFCEQQWDKATWGETYRHPKPKTKGLRP